MKVPVIKNLSDTLTSIKDWNNLRKDKAQEFDLTFGDQDQLDMLSYAGLEEHDDYLCIDGVYIRTLFISGLPFMASTGWLDNLININNDADIIYHVDEVKPAKALKKLGWKITQLESRRRSMIKEGKIVGSEVTGPLQSAINLRDEILQGQQKFFQISIYISLRADSLTSLNDVTRSFETVMAERLFYTRVARYRQIPALQSILPRGEDKLNQKRDLDSSSAALTFPFMSSEMSQENGILYGINNSNNSLVMLNRFGLQNANSITFATSGAGKSYTTKLEISRQLMQGTKVIVIDPDREYEKLCESFKGTYIKLSVSSDNKLNPFDLAAGARTENDLAEHIQDLTEIISLMAEGLDKSEKAGVDTALISVYAKAETNEPRLQDLYAELRELGHLQLSERLEKYISGSLAGVFNASTNIKLENRLVIFDTKDMPGNLRLLMMMIVANFVQNTVKTKPEKRLLVIDEGWSLLKHDETARFIAELTRRGRKNYLGVSIITQQANDFLGNEYGKVIASQSALRILMKQDTTTINEVVSEFDLSDYERGYLLGAARGDTLLIADQNHVAVKVVASKKEHPLITTDPLELYEP